MSLRRYYEQYDEFGERRSIFPEAPFPEMSFMANVALVDSQMDRGLHLLRVEERHEAARQRTLDDAIKILEEVIEDAKKGMGPGFTIELANIVTSRRSR